MNVAIIIQLLVFILIGISGWAIKFKAQYGLISGFISRSKEEQDELIANGYPQKTGSLLFYTSIISIIILMLSLIFENLLFLSMMFFVVVMLGGMFYLSKYETTKKQKKSKWISGLIFIFILFIIVGFYLFNWGGFSVNIEEELEVTGMYGFTTSYEEINNLQLVEEMPSIKIRTNGIGLAHLSKGYFKLENGEKVKLFIYHDTPPYIYFETIDGPVYMNSFNSDETKQWYEQLQEKVNEY